MRSKLQRFKENFERENVIEPGKEIYDQIKGKWRHKYFKNNHPLIVELGCGNGEYTVGLAEKFPKNNYVGVDVKGTRIWRGSKDAIDKGLSNAAFLRTQILQLENFFEPSEITEIWITFPDPRPRKRDIKRRLTSPRFLGIYRDLLVPEGIVHFKTDNTSLFDYTLEVLNSGEIPIKNLESSHDLYSTDMMKDHYGIQTRYEKMFIAEGEKIKYLRFNFDTPADEL